MRISLGCQCENGKAYQLQAEKDVLGNRLDVGTERGRINEDLNLKMRFTGTEGTRCHFTEMGKRQS